MSLSAFLTPRRLTLLAIFLFGLGLTVGSFTGGLWGIIGLGGGIAVFALAGLREKRLPGLDKNTMIALAGFLAIIVIANLPTPYPPVAWHMLLQEITILVPLALWLSPGATEMIDAGYFFPPVICAALAGSAALGIELALGGPLLHAVKGPAASLTEYNRGVSCLAIMAMPLMARLWRQKKYREAVLFFILLLAPLILTESRATKAAFLIGLGAAGMSFVLPKITRATLALLVCALPAFPFAIVSLYADHTGWFSHLPLSWHHRVEIWDYMSYRIFERPWLGWGMGTSHLLPFASPFSRTYQYVGEKAGHPHNVVLQLWVELGIPGLVCGLGFALVTLKKAAALPRPFSAFAVGAWTSALVISLVAYNFWDAALGSIFALTGLAFGLAARPFNQQLPGPAFSVKQNPVSE